MAVSVGPRRAPTLASTTDHGRQGGVLLEALGRVAQTHVGHEQVRDKPELVLGQLDQNAKGVHRHNLALWTRAVWHISAVGMSIGKTSSGGDTGANSDLDHGAGLEVGERHERARQHRRLERDLDKAVDVVEADDAATVDTADADAGATWTTSVSCFCIQRAKRQVCTRTCQRGASSGRTAPACRPTRGGSVGAHKPLDHEREQGTAACLLCALAVR